MLNFDQNLSADRAREQFRQVIEMLKTNTKIVQSNRIKELVEVGPEEQKHRDAVREQERIADFARYWEGRGGAAGQGRG